MPFRVHVPTIFAGLLLASCGGSGGSGSARSTRTVHGALSTLYMLSDGSTETVPGWPAELEDGWPAGPWGGKVTALVVPDSSGEGYTTFKVTLDDNSAFSVEGVPVGRYFLEVERGDVADSGSGLVFVVDRAFLEATSDVPDLSVRVLARPDRVSPTGESVAFDLSNLDPWVEGEDLRVFSPQLGLDEKMTGSVFVPAPAAGATSTSSSLSEFEFEWLPDASLGDVVYVAQRALSSVGSGATAGTWHNATKYQAFPNLTLTNDAGGTISGSLVPVPQTGTFSADLRLSEFALLSSLVNPAAVPLGNGFEPVLDIFQSKASAAYPDLAYNYWTTALSTLFVPTGTVDVDYGELTYGQIPIGLTDWVWFSYQWEVPLGYPAGGTRTVSARYNAQVPMASQPSRVTPVISPVTGITLNGVNAFVPASNVGTQPTLSWKAPSTGTATAYLVTLVLQNPSTNDVASVSAQVFGATSFKVPPGLLKAGGTYWGTVTAIHSDAVLDAPIWGRGGSYYTADSVFGFFVP